MNLFITSGTYANATFLTVSVRICYYEICISIAALKVHTPILADPVSLTSNEESNGSLGT